MIDDRHRALKRWERARQMAGLDADPDLSGPLAWCRVRSLEKNPEQKIRVYVVRLFAKDFVCVRAHVEPIPEGVPGPCWLVRGGIRWDEFLRGIVGHYRSGLSVPEPFRPARKVGTEIITQMENLPDRDLPAVFSKLREVGMLPVLQPLSRTTCPTALPWENLRACFQDFQEPGTRGNDQADSGSLLG